MKRFLCLMLAFLLCFSVCAAAEENAGEEAVSNIVTYGPVSFDTFGKWEKIEEGEIKAFSICEMLNYRNIPDMHFIIAIQDLWNGLLTEEQRTEYSKQVGNQEGFDSIDLATRYMRAYVEEWGGDISSVVTVSLGDYSFCRITEPLILQGWDGLESSRYSYIGVVNGYIIEIFTFFSVNSHYYNDFMDMMETMEIGIADIS